MAMRFFIGFGRKHRHMRGQLRIGELHKHALAAGAAPLVGIELVPGAHVGEEIAVPESAHAEAFVGVFGLNHFRFRIKVAVRNRNLRLIRVIEIHIRLR
jgi:hypothetical protein